ncbi:helix-turn-helix transcriptional regulator [Prosthecobacter vanneervenii]|uniref:Putative DNA-binding transcriptional regulator YafY n=1 Tax=Prosthecobacter vanneervenii TaxID=48466 RepID=A0A7W8DI79_9BACT|nr:YafY family protein [Prosthecobacter vanneervenii]MBB5030738.1 putative DNA-binding transcriptional regulator YafY [Prosthecobacter vanneervenii]
MNRTDRLVSMVMLLQSRRVITAAQLAEHFEITERTVYRDLAALGEGGVPIVGEPGVGYSLMSGYCLPPVMFSPEEAFAFVTGGLLVERMTDASMRDAIRSAMGKVTAVLPAGLQGRVDRLRKTMVIGTRPPTKGSVPLSTVQRAMAEGRVLRLDYLGAARGEPTERLVEPRGLVFYMDHWHLIAWCRLREDMRDFRVDRIVRCETLPEPIPPCPGFNLDEHLAKCVVPDRSDFAIIEVPDYLLESVRRFWGPTIVEEVPVVGRRARVRFAYRSEGLPYVSRWLLSLGTDAEIISPQVLCEKVAEMAQATAEHHRQKKRLG